MSDGGVYIGTDDSTTFRDLKLQKWEAMREDCPCRIDGYCECNTDARCVMELCPAVHWRKFQF
jgi:hypothetical protein